VYIPVSHVYKLACTLHRTINLLPLFHVCPVLPHPTSLFSPLFSGDEEPGNTHCDDKPNKNRLHDLNTGSACNDASHGRKECSASLSEHEDESQSRRLQILREELRANRHALLQINSVSRVLSFERLLTVANMGP
jgi:hypothetical protein